MGEISYILRIYILPILIVFGFLLNMISFCVMKRLRPSTTSKYMGFLALIDSGVLLIGGVSLWMHTLDSNISVTLLSTLSCKLIPFFLYTLADLSVFTIIIMTAERFYAVWRPLKANKFKQDKFKTKITCAIAVSSIINCHFVFTHSVRLAYYDPTANVTTITSNKNTTQEDVLPEVVCIDVIWNVFYEKYWVYIDASIYSFIPSVLLIIFNISIIRNLFKAADESLKLRNFPMNSCKSNPSFILNGSLAEQETAQSFVKSNWQSCNSSIKFNSTETNLHESNTYGNNLNKNTYLDGRIHFKMIKDKFRKNGNQSFNKDSNKSQEIRTIYTKSKASPKSNKRNNFLVKSRSLTPDCSHSTLIAQDRNTITSLNGVTTTSKPANFKRFNTRITLMLIVLNISFCLFSMPMVILQIVYYSLSPLLVSNDNQSKDLMNGLSIPTYSPLTSSSLNNTLEALNNSTQNDAEQVSKLLISNVHADENLIGKMDMFKSIAEILQYLNHSSNFFLYSLSGKTFRDETKEFIKSLLDKFLLLFNIKRKVKRIKSSHRSNLY